MKKDIHGFLYNTLILSIQLLFILFFIIHPIAKDFNTWFDIWFKLIAVSACLVSLSFIPKLLNHKKEIEVEKTELNFDEFKDKHNIEPKAQALIDQLLSDKLGSDPCHNAYSLAIIGSWGSGKTFFVNLMKKYCHQKLKESQNNEYIIFEFNPWTYDNPEQIDKEFLQELSIKLGNELDDPRIEEDLEAYIEIVSSLTQASWLPSFFKANGQKLSITDLKKRISNKLENKKLFIFIDDMDRLDSKETLSTLKLIRNIGDFKNTFFITALDYDYVIHMVSQELKFKEEDSKAYEYLEKFFNQKFYLKPHDLDQAFNTIREEITNKFDYYGINHKNLNLFHNELDKLKNNIAANHKSLILRSNLNSLRRCILYVDRLLSKYKAISEIKCDIDSTVCVKELIYLTLIEIVLPDWYSKMIKYPRTFFDLNKNLNLYVKHKDQPPENASLNLLLELLIPDVYKNQFADNRIKEISDKLQLESASSIRNPENHNLYFNS